MPHARLKKNNTSGGVAGSGLGGSGARGSLDKLTTPRFSDRPSDFDQFLNDPLGLQPFADQQSEGSFYRNTFGSGLTDQDIAARDAPGPTEQEESRALLDVYSSFTADQFTNPQYTEFITFDANGQATYAAPGQIPVQFDAFSAIPEDIRGIPGISSTAEEYAAYVASFTDGIIPPAVRADIVQTASNLRDVEAGRLAAIGRVEGAATRAEEARLAFENDPDRQLVTDLLRERATNPLFSDEERAAAQNALSRASAIADASARAEAGGRGVGGGGLQSSRNAGLDQATAAGGLALSARFEALNREAQDRAVDLLGKFGTAGDQLELAYLGQQTAIDAVLAALENDVNLAEIDFLAFEALEFGRQVFEANEAYRQASLEAFEHSQEYGWEDLVDQFISFIAAGGLPIITGVLGGFFSGDDDDD